MKSFFTSNFFAANRKKLRELFDDTAPIVIAANGLLQRGADSAYDFSQDANFWYLTGLDEPDLVLVMDADEEYLIVPERGANRQAFDGSVKAEYLTERSDITAVYEGEAGWQRLGNRLKKVKQVASVVPPPAYIEQYGLYVNPARATMVRRLEAYNNHLELVDIGSHLGHLRTIKQPEELRAIQSAIDITLASLKDVFQPITLKKYATEYELEAVIGYGFRRRGAAGHAFSPIVAGGERACTLHNIANDSSLARDELVLADVGAEVEHYAADITRTTSMGKPSSRQRAIHGAVLETQDYAISLLKPGVLLKEYEKQVGVFLGKKLKELGLINTVTQENVRQFCPHATSHFLGLNVHDIGDYDRPLEAGMVLTAEPGIYIKYEAIGVRIEDDILITETGAKNLSGELLRELPQATS